MGLSRIIERPGLVIDPSSLPDSDPPIDVEIRQVDGPEDVDALVQLGVLAFGDDPGVGRAFYGAGAEGSSTRACSSRVAAASRSASPQRTATARRSG